MINVFRDCEGIQTKKGYEYVDEILWNSSCDCYIWKTQDGKTLAYTSSEYDDLVIEHHKENLTLSQCLDGIQYFLECAELLEEIIRFNVTNSTTQRPDERSDQSFTNSTTQRPDERSDQSSLGLALGLTFLFLFIIIIFVLIFHRFITKFCSSLRGDQRSLPDDLEMQDMPNNEEPADHSASDSAPEASLDDMRTSLLSGLQRNGQPHNTTATGLNQGVSMNGDGCNGWLNISPEVNEDPPNTSTEIIPHSDLSPDD